MAAVKDAVLSYVKRTVEISFTGEVCCARCPLMETYSRKQCRKSGEYIVDDRTVGGWCPLIDPVTGEMDGIFYQTI